MILKMNKIKITGGRVHMHNHDFFNAVETLAYDVSRRFVLGNRSWNSGCLPAMMV